MSDEELPPVHAFAHLREEVRAVAQSILNGKVSERQGAARIWVLLAEADYPKELHDARSGTAGNRNNVLKRIVRASARRANAALTQADRSSPKTLRTTIYDASSRHYWMRSTPRARTSISRWDIRGAG